MGKNEVLKILFQNKRNDLQKGIKPTIIDARVVNIFSKHILVVDIITNEVYTCHFSDISDFRETSISSIFKINNVYKFIIKRTDNFRNKCVSYKSLHPECIRFKYKPVSTISHYRNLYTFLTNKIKEYEES